MRQGCALLLALLTASLAGCVTGGSATASTWTACLRPFQGLTGDDVVQMDVALLQCPVGDRYLNQDLWSFTDEQVIDFEKKATLEDNGFRVGQVGGILPAGLQDLLQSDRSNVNPRRLQVHADNPRALVLGPPLGTCGFDLHQNGRAVPVSLKDGQCVLQVVPSLTQDGRTRLHFTPEVQHGDNMLVPRPAPDRSGWMRQEQRPTEEYPALGWDVVLAPNEYVLVGARYEHPGTLGHQCFLRGDEPVPVQRLLVIRTTRAAGGVDGAAGNGEEDATPGHSPPLALQASWSTVRSCEP